MTRFIPLLAVLSAAILAAPRAEPAAGGAVFVESLELAIADADLVVRGAVSEIDRVKDKKNVIWTTATVKVAETIKGEKVAEVKFIAGHTSRFANDRLYEIGKEKGEVIFCLVKSDRYKDQGADYATLPWALREGRGDVDHNVIDLSDKSKTFVVPNDCTVLFKRDDIVKAAQAAGAAAAMKAPPQGKLRAPATAEVARKLSEGGAVWLFVPVDDRLKEQAKTWLASNDLDNRAAGARTLANFKSDDHIALLKKLLDDPQGREEGKVKRYPVRQAAYDVLKEWGVAVKQPIVEEK